MRYIKKFEELSPDIYKRAGIRLKDSGHVERGIDLLTYGHDKAGDILNFWVGEIDYTTSFTNPIEAYYVGCKVKLPTQKEFQHYTDSKYHSEYWEKSLLDIITQYKRGHTDLFFDIQLFFKISPRQLNQLKNISNKISKREITGEETGMKDQQIIHTISKQYSTFPLLTLRLHIADNVYWGDPDGDYQAPTEEEFQDGFDNNFYPRLLPIEGEEIIIPTGSNSKLKRRLIATLCSRSDANKFRSKVMPEVIEDVKPLIQELFSEYIQTSPDNFEKAVNAMKPIVNKFYRNKINNGGNSEDFKKQFI